MRSAFAVALHQLPTALDNEPWSALYWCGIHLGWWETPAAPLDDYHRVLATIEGHP